MKTLLLTAFFLTSFITATVAQQAGKISGRIMTNEKGADGATVALLRARDSATIKLSLSNKEGYFVFENVATGKYVVSATAVGHKKSFSQAVELTPGNSVVTITTINLVPVAKALTGVSVTATRPLVEHKIDRTIVNVDASVTNIGSSALDILEKSPGITVDKDGNISLKGKEGVMVTIDGRPTQLSGADLANLLRSMNSNQMDQVEIMTNPPARYDAAGNAGIINIKTKKTNTDGYNGSLTLGYIQGRYPKTNEGFNFNFRKGKVNLFTNLSHNYRKGFETLTIQRNLLGNNSNQLENYFDQRGDKIASGNAYSAKIGIDYFATKKTTFGVVLNRMSSPRSVINKNRTDILTASKELQNVTLATVDNNSNFQNYSGTLNFRTVLNPKGRELTADLDYMTYDADNSLFMENGYYNAAGGSLNKADTLTGSLPQKIDVYSGRIDYVHPLNKKTKIEAGIKSSIVNTDNDANYDSIQYGRIVHDFNRSNHFVYRENINAAYLNLSSSLTKKLSAQFGLRLENTNARGNQLTTGETFTRDYTSLFPTAYFQYKANEKNQ